MTDILTPEERAALISFRREKWPECVKGYDFYTLSKALDRIVAIHDAQVAADAIRNPPAKVPDRPGWWWFLDRSDREPQAVIVSAAHDDLYAHFRIETVPVRIAADYGQWLGPVLMPQVPAP